MGSRVSSVKTQGVFNKRNCQECKDRMNLNNFPVISFDCHHRPKTCHICLLHHVHEHLDSGAQGEMRCPHPKCTQTLSKRAMMRLPYSKDLMQQYNAVVSSCSSQLEQLKKQPPRPQI